MAGRMIMRKRLWLLAGLMATVSLVSSVRAVPPVPESSGTAIFTAQCAGCHGRALEGGQFAPPLKGPAFAARWAGKADALLKFVTTNMPPGASGSLSPAEYAAATQVVLAANDGGQVLPEGASADTASPLICPHRVDR